MKIYIHSIGDCGKCGIILDNLMKELKIKTTNNPKRSDLLIIVGCLLKNQEQSLIEIWNNATNAKVLLFGDCPIGISELFSYQFKDMKNLAISAKKIEELIPVDYILEGCPPNLEVLSEVIKKIFFEN